MTSGTTGLGSRPPGTCQEALLSWAANRTHHRADHSQRAASSGVFHYSGWGDPMGKHPKAACSCYYPCTADRVPVPGGHGCYPSGCAARPASSQVPKPLPALLSAPGQTRLPPARSVEKPRLHHDATSVLDQSLVGWPVEAIPAGEARPCQGSGSEASCDPGGPHSPSAGSWLLSLFLSSSQFTAF